MFKKSPSVISNHLDGHMYRCLGRVFCHKIYLEVNQNVIITTTEIRTKIKEDLSPWLGLEPLVKKTKLRGPKLNELRVRILNLNSFNFGPANLMFLSV